MLPAAITIVAAGAVVVLWQELRRDHEARIANVVEATSYATRSELAAQVKTLLKDKAIRRTGVKRGTTYYAK